MNRFAGAVAVLWTVVFSSGVAADPVMIVAFGDSTTAPRIVDGKALGVYADVVRRELPAKGVFGVVVNAGIPGHTTADGRARFARDVLAYCPSLVVIQYGINDSAVDVWRKPPATESRVSLAEYERNLRGFMRQLRGREVGVILMTPNPLRWTAKLKELYGKGPFDPSDPEGFQVLLRTYADKVRQIAADEKVALVDVDAMYAEYGKRPGQAVDDLLLDGMHPNAEGHRMVAGLLISRIVEMVSSGRVGGKRWRRLGAGVLLNPICTDVTHDTEADCVFGPGMARLGDGRVMSVYSIGNAYGAPGSTYVAYRVTGDGGKTWSGERKIVTHPECQACHPSVLLTKDGTIHVFYLGFKRHVWKDGNPTPEDQSDIWAINSRDGGKTWTDRQVIYKGYSGATNGAIETGKGTILVPFSHYVSNPGRLVSRTAFSADGGKTWSLSNALDIGGRGDHDGAIEPAVIELKDGRIWMLIRATRGVFWQSFSRDGGRTWEQASKTSIEATSAPGHLARLSDGRIAMVWNPRRSGRGELRIAASADEGKTWADPIVLAMGKQVTYPFVMEGAAGEVWIGFHDLHNGWGRQRMKLVKMAVGCLR
ncbi:MAG: exo-alpha-sialidase [Phycisphaerae bacterium]|nr:exo-alpha-sialidase [Phycisphaerae bacterium]